MSADKYSVGQQQEISLEIKPTSHTGLLLSSWNAKGDYIVLEMSSGNVSNVLGRCDAFNLNWSKLWCKVNPSKVGSFCVSGKLPTYFTLRDGTLENLLGARAKYKKNIRAREN